MRVFINGFGRIGRSVLRAWAEAPSRWPEIEIAGINDIAEPEMCAYLLEYDSVFGPWKSGVSLGAGGLEIAGCKIPLYRTPDISTLDLSGIDLVMECTGMGGNRSVAERGLRAGASRVLISGPSDTADLTVVLGANEAELADQPIVSNASCTTNALAPLARLIDDHWGLISGSMVTVHCYTSSQPTTDAPGKDYARSRAAALSMVPTTTSASRLVDRVLPALAGRLQGSAVRVPTASVSCVDLTVLTERQPDVAEVNAVLARAPEGYAGVIGVTERPLVSTDLRARRESIVMATPETRATPQGLLRVFGWYDNEWGFSNRMLDIGQRMG